MGIVFLALGSAAFVLSIIATLMNAFILLMELFYFKKGTKVIVRSYHAGVVYGEYYGMSGKNGNTGNTVMLKNARQLWEWKSARGVALQSMAVNGIDPTGCKFSDPVKKMTVLEACAIMSVSDHAAAQIEAVK